MSCLFSVDKEDESSSFAVFFTGFIPDQGEFVAVVHDAVEGKVFPVVGGERFNG